MSSEYQELLEKLLNSDTTDVIPQSRAEYIMLTAINSLNIDTLPEPGSRMEAYLMALITKMGEGGSASGDSLIVTYNPDGRNKATHSSSEIYEASQSGKTVRFYTDGRLFRLTVSNPDVAIFTFGGVSELKDVSFMTILISYLSEIETIGPAFVPTTPATAKVGQTIVVKSVDETDHPIEWEAVEIPSVLPNPNALTFTGAVTGSYDGSAPLSVEIPSGEGGTGGGDDVFELIGEATSSGVSDIVGLTIPFDGSLYKTIIAYAYNLPAGNQKRIIIRNKKAWYDGYPLGWNGVKDIYQDSMTQMKNTWGFFGAAIDVGGKLFTLGAAEANANGGHGYLRFWPQNGALPTLNLSNCKFISLDCNSNSETLPDGCSLIVWGVRK